MKNCTQKIHKKIFGLGQMLGYEKAVQICKKWVNTGLRSGDLFLWLERGRPVIKEGGTPGIRPEKKIHFLHDDKSLLAICGAACITNKRSKTIGTVDQSKVTCKSCQVKAKKRRWEPCRAK